LHTLRTVPLTWGGEKKDEIPDRNPGRPHFAKATWGRPGFVYRLPVFAQGYAEASALASDRLRTNG